MKLPKKLLALVLLIMGFVAGYFLFDSKSAKAFNPGDLIISEFSLTPSGQWIELLNTTGSDIDLSDWDVSVTSLSADDTVSGGPSSMTMSGLVPANGMLVVYGVDLWLGELPTPSFLQLINNSDVISAVSYGYHFYTAPYVDQPDYSAGETAMQDNEGNWSVTTSVSLGWYNITTSTLDCDSPPTPGPGVTPPSLSAIELCLPSGVTSNITSGITDPTNATGLYFEKEGMGEIVFGSTLNLTDQNTLNLLQNLKTKLELDGGKVRLDASTATLIRDVGAEIYFYGLKDLGYDNIDTSSIIVRDDSGDIIPTSSVDYPEITGVNWYDTNTGTLQFNTEHFSGYETSPILSEVTPVPDPTGTTTPDYTFSANVTGTYVFLGDCAGTPTGSTTNGNNTITIGPVSESYHSNCAVKVIDGAGNSSTLQMSPFTVDVTGPQMATTTPNPTCVGAGAVGSSTFTFTVNYNEPMDQTATPTVFFDPPLYAVLVDSSRTYSWVSSTVFRVTSDVAMQDGTVVTNVTSTVSSTKDMAGNYSADNVIVNSFYVDFATSSAPSLDTVNGSMNHPQTGSNSNPPIVVSGLTIGDILKIYDGATEIDSVTATATTMARTLSLTEGSHDLSAKAVDPCGNVSDASNVITYILDLTAPSAPVITEINGSTSSPAYGNTSTPQIKLTGEIGTYYYLYDTDGVTVLATNAVMGSPEIFYTSPLSVGTHTLTAKLVDSGNNTSTASASFNYIYDITPPSVVSVSTTKPDGAYPKDAIVGINVNFDETVTVNGTPWLYLNVGVGRYAPWLAFGMNYFSYTVVSGDASQDLDYASTTALILNGGTIKDLAGNDAVLTLPATGTFAGAYDIIIDTATPTVAFTDDVEAGPVASDTITITVSDANPYPSSYAYAYSSDAVCDGSDTYSTSFTSGSSFTVSYNTNNGKYICARARDLANNTTYLASANPLNVSTAPPSSGGGGSSRDMSAPTNISLKINNGATSTASTTVTLNMTATDATYMKISNSQLFTGAEWETFSTSKTWVLEAGLGEKKVWVQFRDDAYNLADSLYDTIQLVLPGEESPVITVIEETQKSAVGPSCPVLSNGDMVKVIGKPAIYSVDKYLQALYFPSGDEFKSWRPTYGGYLSIDQACFDSLNVPKNYPAAVNYRPGSYLIKRPSSDQLYVILPGNTLAKITPEAAEALYGTSAYSGGVGNKVMTVSDVFWPHYVNRSADITEAKAHAGMVIKVSGKIYYVDMENKLREMTTAGFSANGIQERFIRAVQELAIAGLVEGDLIEMEIQELTNKTQSF